MRSTGQQAVAEQALWINSVREKSLAQGQKQDQKQKQNRGSAVPLRVKGYPLKLGLKSQEALGTLHSCSSRSLKSTDPPSRLATGADRRHAYACVNP